MAIAAPAGKAARIAALCGAPTRAPGGRWCTPGRRAPCCHRTPGALLPLLQDSYVTPAAGLRHVGRRRGRRRNPWRRDVVTAAVAIGAGGGADQARRKRLGVLARQIPPHHLLVAMAAVAHLIEGRHRVVRIVGARRGMWSPWHPAQVAADTPGALAVLQLVDRPLVTPGAGRKHRGTEIPVPGWSTVRASRWQSVQASPPCAEAANTAAATFSEPPAASFIVASS